MKVYLSSSFRSLYDHDVGLLTLRKDIQNLGRSYGHDVVLAEDLSDAGAPLSMPNDMAILDRCVRLMGECDAFLGILFERHGSLVRTGDTSLARSAEVSFFEAELLQACMTDRPSLVVTIDEFPPDLAMQQFLEMVNSVLRHRIVETRLKTLFDKIATFFAILGSNIGPHLKAPKLVDRVSWRRVRRSVGVETLAPRLLFLDGLLAKDGQSVADESVIRFALGQARRASESAGETANHIFVLSQLWIAIRELAKCSAAERQNDLGEVFAETLRRWNTSAAWYGLHGSHPMGCLAALNQIEQGRSIASELTTTYGARASAYYSIGAQVRSYRARRRFFHQSLALCHANQAEQSSNLPGHLTMTANVEMRLLRLGEAWRYPTALSKFRQALDLRERLKTSDHEIGSSKVEYGFAYGLLPGRRSAAIRIVAEGIAAMTADRSPIKKSFLVRARRKHAHLLMKTRRLDEALYVLKTALGEARQCHAFDQAQQIEPVVQELTTKLRSKRN